MNLKFIFIFIGLAVIAPCVFGEETQGAGSSRETAQRQLLQQYDANRNGKLDPDEIEAIGRDRRLRFDDNNDGKVDSYEMAKQRPNVRKMPKKDALERAMNREKALQDERVQKSK